MSLAILTASCGVGFVNKSADKDLDVIVKRLINHGKYKEAADLINNTAIKSQEDIQAQINVAWIYAFNNHYNEALDIADKILWINSKYQELYYLKGYIYQKTQSYQLAIKNLKIAINLDPRDIKSYNSLAEVYQAEQKYDEAIYYYKLLTKLQPENYVYYLDLANTYFKKNDLKKALVEAQNAYNHAPQAEKENVSEILENIKLSAILGQNK